MLVLIYEVQLNHKIIYFDIDIRILFILQYYVVNIVSFIVTCLSSGLIGYYLQVYIDLSMEYGQQ